MQLPIFFKKLSGRKLSKIFIDKGSEYKNKAMKEYWNIKTFLQKEPHQIGEKNFLWLKKLKILLRGHILLMILMAKTLLERFSKKNYKKWIEKSLWLKKNKEKNVKNYMQIGKVMIILLTAGLIEKKLLYKMSYFPELKKDNKSWSRCN